MGTAAFAKPHGYHAFLSYNTKDVEKVDAVEAALTRAGLNVYFAPANLRAGLKLNKEMELAIEQSRCLVLFIGKKIGVFQQAEVDYASMLMREIIKVVLPGGNPRAGEGLYNSKTLDCNHPAVAYQLIDHLIESIAGMPLIRWPLQIRTDHRIGLTYPPELQAEDSRRRVLTVHSLSAASPAGKLLLNWVTFGRLIENLRQQIKTYSGCHPDAYFGINAAGLAAVQFLNDYRVPVGFIHHDGPIGSRRISVTKSTFPELEGDPEILVVDSELKSGSGMEAAVKAIREKYPKAAIYYAVLGAMMKSPGADRDLKALEAWSRMSQHIEQKWIKAFFIASTFDEPGIDPPLEIR